MRKLRERTDERAGGPTGCSAGCLLDTLGGVSSVEAYPFHRLDCSQSHVGRGMMAHKQIRR